MKNFRASVIISLLTIIFANPLSAQDFVFPNFKAYQPFRELKSALWINAVGDIAYKTIGCEMDDENEELIADSLKSKCTTVHFKYCRK